MGESREISYYETLRQSDIIRWIRPLLENGNWALRADDGKLYVRHPHLAYEYAWHYVRLDRMVMECWIFHTLIHNTINKAIPEPFIHSRCHRCFKVVVLPRTLKELFALEQIQLETDYQCKYGLDLRPYTDTAYAGFFYQDSLAAGVRTYIDIRERVDEAIGPDVPVYLKRGCTEFERDLGPSNQWRKTKDQDRIERAITELLVPEITARIQPPDMVRHTHAKMIEHAAMIGDKTYLEYTGGEPPIPPAVTYHHLAEEYKQSTKGLMEATEKAITEAIRGGDGGGEGPENPKENSPEARDPGHRIDEWDGGSGGEDPGPILGPQPSGWGVTGGPWEVATGPALSPSAAREDRPGPGGGRTRSPDEIPNGGRE